MYETYIHLHAMACKQGDGSNIRVDYPVNCFPCKNKPCSNISLMKSCWGLRIISQDDVPVTISIVIGIPLFLVDCLSLFQESTVVRILMNVKRCRVLIMVRLQFVS